MRRDHKRLRVFHDAHLVTVAIYKHTRKFPNDETFGVRTQMRRAAVFQQHRSSKRAPQQ